jgi:3'(2'), 5'-bisphosphate nucleotidase
MAARPEDHADAARLAESAGRLLLEIRAGGATPALRQEGDRRSHALLAVLSEEAPDDAARLGADRVWIIDPLDGTREFGEPGRTDWAVHVALVVDHVPVAGAVALPAQGVTLHTAAPPPLPPAGPTPRIVVSRTRAPAWATRLALALDAELVPMGSAGAKTMAVVRGEADVYVHGGGQYEWDSAAPVAVARAAGLHTSRLDGSALAYNQPRPWLPDLLVCRPELADRLLGALADLPAR